MKNKLLSLILFLGSYAAYSQVGIGTPMPNASAQLEVVASDKGVLIPRITLTGTTDATTITSGNVTSLLVFNTASVSDVKPGYYYWYDNKWNRIVISNEVTASPGSVIFNPTTQQFSYVDNTGTTQNIDINAIVKASETLTTLVNNGAGSYTYTNEGGATSNIDVVGDVITNASTILNNPAFKTEITQVIKTEETVTTLVNNGGGSYTYNNEAGTPVNIDVVGDVTSNFSTIVSNPAVTNLIENIVNTTAGNVTYDATTNQFTYTDATGTTQVVDITSIVKASETLTTLDKDAANNGKYVYKSENATQTTIDVVGDVITNASTILNDPSFKTEITQVIKTEETLTTLINNGGGSYTYTNEAGTPVNIDVVGDVTSNFSTIVNDPAVTNLIENIVNTTSGNVTFDAATNQFSYVDSTGTTQVVDISTIVKANETLTTLDKDPANNGKYVYTSENATPTTIDVVGDVITNASTILNDPAFTTELTNVIQANETLTTLVNNGAGSYTYTNEAGTAVNIEVVGDVTSNFSTIVNDPAVTNIIENIVNKTEGNVTFDAATNQFSYVDATGTTQVVDISTIVKANETITTLVKNAANDGTYLYTSENATPTTIDVVGDVITNASTIINDPAFKTEITDVIKTEETVTTLVKNAADDGTYVFTSEDATATTIDVVGDVITNASTILNDPTFKTDLTQVIKTEETVTTLVNNGAGSYTYTNESGTPVNINVVGDVTSNFSTIVNDPAVTNIIENIVNKTAGNVTFDSTTNQFSYVDSTGTTQVVDISTIVKANETITTLVKNAANNGTYLYTSENATPTTIDVVGDVITNASTILNDPSFKTDLTNVIKSEETVTTLVKNAANDGTYLYTSEDATATTIDVVGDVISNASTIVNDPAFKTEITDVIKTEETVTTLVKNAANDGTYLYTSEDATATTIDVVGDVISNASTIVNNPAFKTEITDVIKTEETVTTLVKNAANNGTYLYTSEDATPTTIDVVGDVITNASTILNNPAFTTDLTTIIKANETLTTQAQNLTTGAITYTNEAGTPVISQVVSANPGNLVTVGTDGGSLLTSAALATATTVANASSVNTSTVTVNGVTSTGAPIINTNANSLAGTNLTTTINGVASTPLDLGPEITAGQVVTTLVKNAANNGTYLYTSENATATTIDVVGDVISNASTIVNDPAFKTEITDVIKAEETITTQAQNLTTGAITYTNEAGAPVTSQVVSANAGNLVTVGTDGGALLTAAAITTPTTVSNTSVVNTLTTTVNGVAATGVPIVNTNAASLTGSSLTTTVNGVASTALDLAPAIAAATTVSNASAINTSTVTVNGVTSTGAPIVNTNTTSLTGSSLTTTVNGVASTALDLAPALTAATTVSNTSAANNLTTTVNGVAATAVPIINSNAASLTGSTLTTTVNGIASTPVDLAPAITAAQTVTTQAQNLTTGAITYTNEAATAVTSQVVSANAGNLITVGTDGGSLLTPAAIATATTVSNASAVNTGTVTVNGITSTGAPIINSNATSLTGANLTTTINGVASTPLDLGPAIKAGETLTSLTDVVTQVTDEFGNIKDVHTLTYTDEASVANPIDLSILVKGTETLTALTYDGVSLSYKDELGNSTDFKLVDLVGEAQTLTTLQVNLATGNLDYKDEDGIVNPVDLSAAVKEPWFSTATNIGATLNTENIYTNGWVGIGYTTPSAATNEKLRVNGSITTINSYYADYVFEDYFKGFSNIKADYKFKPLSEVEDYIKKNKHLPGITPINELEKTKEGYSFNMSELSIQLLEKTEELYLHIIEQNKDIEAKDKEIKELKEASASMNQRLEKLEKLILEKK